MKKKNTILYRFIITGLFLTPLSFVWLSGESHNNQLLKNRVIRRRSHQKETSVKVHSLLERSNKSMEELASFLDDLPKLFTILDVDSMEKALEKVEKMQQDINTLLKALQSESVPKAVDQAKKIRSVFDQLSQLQTKVLQS